MKEIEDSLRRLRTDVIDLYQIHWPDPNTPIEETAGAMAELLQGGQNPRDRREQFLAGANGCFSRRSAAARGAAAL